MTAEANTRKKLAVLLGAVVFASSSLADPIRWHLNTESDTHASQSTVRLLINLANNHGAANIRPGDEVISFNEINNSQTAWLYCGAEECEDPGWIAVDSIDWGSQFQGQGVSIAVTGGTGGATVWPVGWYCAYGMSGCGGDTHTF